jgi:tetratricopeptide (TPR) repeat protein
VIGRLAAALLGGAAVVHFADLAFYAGQVLGVSGVDGGRGLVLLLAALPGALLARVAWDRAVAGAAFLLGGCAAYFANEWFLLPRLGWGWTTLLWGGLWAVARLVRPKDAAEPHPPRSVAVFAGAVLAGIAAGFVFAALRPFLFQHVAGTRHGLRIAVVSGLAGLATGAALGHVLKDRMARWGVSALGIVFGALGAATTFLLLPRASPGLTVPLLTGAWSSTWWGSSILASWAMLGVLTVALGLLLPLLDRRNAMLFLILGVAAGTKLGEESVRALGKDPAEARALADLVARHPILQRIEAARFTPEGIWTRYRTRTLLEVESIGHWQAVRLDRGELWKNLEAAEVEGATRVFAMPRGLFDGPFADRAGKEDVVWRSGGFLPSGSTLREGRWAGPFGSFRDWCDPRALTPAGLRSLLATWREVLPDATFSVLVDGYSGPLLGLRVGGDPSKFPIARQLTVFEAKASAAFRGELGPVSTTLRPVLEWETAPEPSPFLHPTADVMRALVAALAIEPGSPVDHLFRGLVLHADEQIVRPYVVSAWDHVAVPEAEVREYMAALAKDERSPAVIQHLQIVFEVLLKKREYAMLVRHLEEAVARRPDVFAFHRTLGKAYADILDFANAVEELTQARALQPDHHEVAIELSRALGGAKRWPEAVQLLESELLEHDAPEIRKGLAIALTEAGELDRARALVRELTASYPADLDLMKVQDRLTRAESR